MALPRPVIGVLADALEKASKRPVLYALEDSAAPDKPEPTLDAGAGALLARYGTALERYSERKPEKALAIFQDVKLQILSDPALHLRDARLADALADSMLLMADIALGLKDADDARGWLREYFTTFPTRELPGARYTDVLVKTARLVRTEMMRDGGGRASLRAELSTADLYLNGFRVGRGAVEIAWLPEGTYQAWAVEGSRSGPSTELLVWSGKSVALALRLDAPPPPSPLLVRLATRADEARWAETRSDEIGRRLLMAGAAREAIVVRARRDATGVAVSCTLFRDGGFLDGDDDGLYDVETVLLPAGADEKAAAKVLRSLASVLAKRLESGGVVVRVVKPTVLSAGAPDSPAPTPAAGGTSARPSGGTASPAPAPPELVLDPAPPAAGAAGRPLFARWWFWTGVGAVAVAGAAVAIGVAVAGGAGCPREATYGCYPGDPGR
ncbi:MAG TPA: hypothetical protein VG389_11985 [Myxococcota bacterium]|nr:hypothetical protein [Myxococcota bacterium]